jgi:ribosomal protein L18
MLDIKNIRKSNPRLAGRLRRKLTIRKRVCGFVERPRLVVFCFVRHIYA